MKKLFKIMCILLICAIAGAVLSACNNGGVSEALTYVSLRINPQIELIIDENNIVVAVNAMNEDGEIVLAELNLTGLSIEEASELFTAKASELGYLDVDGENSTVYVQVDGENNEVAEMIRNKIRERIHGYFDNNGIYGKVSEETLAEYASQAADWNVSVGHAKMILRILDMYPEMTPSDLLALSVKERIALIKGNKEQNGIAAGLKDEYKAAFAALKDKYANMFALETEIESLKEQLAVDGLTEEEKATIQANIDAKETEYALLYEAFKSEFDALKTDLKQKTVEAKTQLKALHNSKKAENTNKIKAHNEKFKGDSEKIKERIRQWRRAQNGSI